MAESLDIEPHPRGSLEFAETSILDAIIPLENNLDIEAALGGSVESIDDPQDSPLASIPQRSALYFGKRILSSLIVHCLTHT